MSNQEPAFEQGQWEFDNRVTDQFDEMLERSIPQYELMRETCYGVGRFYIQDGTDIVDLGCSRGEAVKKFLDDMGARNRYSLVEASEPMFQAVSDRYKAWVESGVMRIFHKDLRTFYPSVRASLTLSILTLMFTPIEYRLGLLHKMFESTLDGGAVVLVEKILGASASLDETFTKNYYDLKNRNGYDAAEIERKRLALEGKLVPVTFDMNVQLLRSAGFREVDSFWRWCNFAGFVAIK